MKNPGDLTQMIRATRGCVDEIERLQKLMLQNARLSNLPPEQIERIGKDTFSITIRLACTRWADQLAKENEKLRNA